MKRRSSRATHRLARGVAVALWFGGWAVLLFAIGNLAKNVSWWEIIEVSNAKSPFDSPVIFLAQQMFATFQDLWFSLVWAVLLFAASRLILWSWEALQHLRSLAHAEGTDAGRGV